MSDINSNISTQEHYSFVNMVKERLSNNSVIDFMDNIADNVAENIKEKTDNIIKTVKKPKNKNLSMILMVALFFGLFYLFIIRKK